MITAGEFIEAARARGFGLYTGVPCSYLTPFINHVISTPDLRYVGTVNEGDAVAVAAGAELGGMPAVVMFQNSGLGNAVNPLTSLAWAFRVPMLLIVTWRGQPGGAADEPQHELMGRITPQLLEAMDIPWEPFPAESGAIAAALERACDHMRREGRPYALVMSKGAVAPSELETRHPEPQQRLPAGFIEEEPMPRVTRRAMLRAVQMALREDDIVVATTGYTGRELCALEDRPCQLYMVGSMGCAAGIGLGLAIAQPERRVIVIDGDGALLMRLGTMATLGMERPRNLLHILLDNGMHESTGGQATVSVNVDFRALARAVGYPRAMIVSDPDELREYVDWRAPGLRLLHVPIRPGIAADLPRPEMGPAEVAARLRRHLGVPAPFGG